MRHPLSRAGRGGLIANSMVSAIGLELLVYAPVSSMYGLISYQAGCIDRIGFDTASKEGLGDTSK